jgi:hypothetical protein
MAARGRGGPAPAHPRRRAPLLSPRRATRRRALPPCSASRAAPGVSPDRTRSPRRAVARRARPAGSGGVWGEDGGWGRGGSGPNRKGKCPETAAPRHSPNHSAKPAPHPGHGTAPPPGTNRKRKGDGTEAPRPLSARGGARRRRGRRAASAAAAAAAARAAPPRAGGAPAPAMGRIVPWASWDEWGRVKALLASQRAEDHALGIELVRALGARGGGGRAPRAPQARCASPSQPPAAAASCWPPFAARCRSPRGARGGACPSPPT